MDPGLDPESGLIYLRARYYDPTTAQFLTVDPLVQTTRHPYSYASGNPISWGDPSGRDAEAGAVSGCALGEAVDPLGGCLPGAVGGATVEELGSLLGDAVSLMAGENSNANDQTASQGQSESSGCNAAEDGVPDPANLEQLKDRQIKQILEREGTNPHADKEATVGKGAAGDYKYYVDKTTGQIYLVPGRPGDLGEPIPTGLSR